MKLSPELQAKLDKLRPEERKKVERAAAEALLLHHLNRKRIEPSTTVDEKRGYNCISAQLAWSGNDSADERVKSILAERAARLAGEALNVTPKSEKD